MPREVEDGEENKNGEENEDALPEASRAPAPEVSRSALDTACLRMMEAAAAVKSCCDAFEALLLVPGGDLGEFRRTSAAVRLAGVQSMSLTTAYLTELNRYVTAVDRRHKEAS